MKNKGLIITMIILLSLIVVFLIVILCLGINGKLKFRFFKTGKAELLYNENYNITEIEKIEIASAAGNISIKESNDKNIKVEVYGEKDEDIKVELNQSTLQIKYNQKPVIFGINISTTEIIVYIPKEYEKELKISSDYGDIEVTDLENATLEIEQSCGDVKIGKIKNITAENNLGKIELKEVSNKLDIESDCGDVKIEKVNIKEDSKIKNDLGNVKIKEINDIYIDAHCDLGDCKIKNNNRQSEVTLKIDVDCGDIKVENE